jgi:hypothetical protein
MGSFNYLSVLLSIVLGLAIAQILQGFRAIILSRAQVRLYLPSLLWAGLTLLIVIQGWWASFGMRLYANWNFAAFLVIILHAVCAYMVAALVLPNITGDEYVDLRSHYFAHKGWFFGALLASDILSAAKDLALYGHLPGRMNAEFHIIFGLAVGVAAVTRREWIHKGLAPLMALLFVLYISLLFARL